MEEKEPVTFDEIVPWGRSFEEYCRMFDLSVETLPDSILDCGGGPSSFSAVASQHGVRAVSVDPLYQFSPETIQKRINEVTPDMLQLMHEERQRFELDRYDSPEEVVEARRRAMRLFLEDYQAKHERDRYITGTVMDLDFSDHEFQLALSSHFLLLYDEKLSLDDHLRAVREAARVAGELRVFPLRNVEGKQSRVLPDLLEVLGDEGFQLEIQEVPYEFQSGAHEMLVIEG